MARQTRFRKPDFQEKLARARGYERRVGGVTRRLPRYFVFVCALVILYFLAISHEFLVRDASVNDAAMSDEQIRSALGNLQDKRLWFIIPSNHILVLNKADLFDELRRVDPKMRTISMMKRSWPNRLALNLEMREPRYVWQSGTEYFLLDQDGVIFEQIPSYTPEVFSQSLIEDSSAALVTPGTTLAVQRIIKFIEDVRSDWPVNINETSIVSFSVPAVRSKDIIVKTAIGFNLYFDLERGVADQLSDLKIVLREQIRAETFSGLSYIDLRLPSIAYYCYRDAPCAPEYSTSTPPTL